jgi:AmmeMemoRadiSam system protein A
MVELDRDQQIKVLRLARGTIREYLQQRRPPEPDMALEFSDPVFREKCGAFVSLHINKRLRGCIGYIKGIKNIPETVIDMSMAAAFQDPRFPPLSMKEFDAVDIEVSILSPLEPVTDISDIQVCRDGLIISCGRSSGLLLPQVAEECGWDTMEFLQHTCFKAGLPGDAWKRKDAKIEKFCAQVFGEKSLGLFQ